MTENIEKSIKNEEKGIIPSCPFAPGACGYNCGAYDSEKDFCIIISAFADISDIAETLRNIRTELRG